MKGSKLKSENGVFVASDGVRLTPEQFGIMAVKSAIDDTIKDATEIVGNNETEFRRALAIKAEGVHLNLIALQSAVLYVYAAQFLAVPNDVLGKIYQGITTGFNKLIVNIDGSSVDKWRIDILDAALRLYIQSLSVELHTKTEDMGLNLDRGTTASKFSQSMSVLCGVEEKLQASQIDKLLIETIAAANGIIYLLELGDNQPITYIRQDHSITSKSSISSDSNKQQIIPGHTPLTLGNKIFLAVLGIWMLLGLINIMSK